MGAFSLINKINVTRTDRASSGVDQFKSVNRVKFTSALKEVHQKHTSHVLLIRKYARMIDLIQEMVDKKEGFRKPEKRERG